MEGSKRSGEDNVGVASLGSVRVAGEGQRWRRRRRERKAERKEWCWNEESGSKWGEVWVGGVMDSK